MFLETTNLYNMGEIKTFNRLLDLKYEMMYAVQDIMTAYFTDIVYDFDTVEKMNDGDILYWCIRDHGTHMYNNHIDFENCVKGWKGDVQLTAQIELHNDKYTIRYNIK